MNNETTINRYVNILMDKWFRRILGSEANKEALLAILNELIPERDIVDISYNRKKLRKNNPFEDCRDAFFDVECVDANGSRFVVEMQQEKQVHFRERVLFYSTFPIQEQVLADEAKKSLLEKIFLRKPKYVIHDEHFNYPPVYIISFLNFSLHENTDQVLFRYDLREQTTGDQMTDRINFIFLEMTNYRKQEPEECDSFAEKLSYALTNMSILKSRPAALIEKVFGLLFAACDIDTLSPQEQHQYKEDMTTKWDRENILYTKWLDGKNEGLAEGRAEGREEGREEGRAEGKQEAATKLKKLGVLVETIAEATGLSIEEIEAL